MIDAALWVGLDWAALFCIFFGEDTLCFQSDFLKRFLEGQQIAPKSSKRESNHHSNHHIIFPTIVSFLSNARARRSSRISTAHLPTRYVVGNNPFQSI